MGSLSFGEILFILWLLGMPVAWFALRDRTSGEKSALIGVFGWPLIVAFLGIAMGLRTLGPHLGDILRAMPERLGLTSRSRHPNRDRERETRLDSPDDLEFLDED